MGRWWGDGKNTTNEYKGIDIRLFKKRWYLDGRENWYLRWTRNWNETGSMSLSMSLLECYIKFSFTHKSYNEETPYNLKVNLAKTSCNYWWYRYWFICPDCQKRYVSLYLWYDSHFHCRKCLNLCYEDQKSSNFSRLLNRIHPKYGAKELYQTIKYKYRNNKMTRKYARYCRMMRIWRSTSDLKAFFSLLPRN